MRRKGVQETTIIGGADGPVSVFIAGKGKNSKMPLKARIHNMCYQMKRRRTEKKIYPSAHTKAEIVAYAKEKYGFLPMDPTHWKYKSRKKGGGRASFMSIGRIY